MLQAAVALADDAGLEAFSMRGLAQELGVVPMALYKHVANKERAPRRHGRHRLRRDRAPDRTARLEGRDAAPGDLHSRGAAAPRLGDRDDGVAASGAGEPAKPQRGDGLPARGGVLVQDGDPRLLGPGRLHLRLRPAGKGYGVRDPRQCGRSRAAQGGRRSARSRTTRTCVEIAKKLPETGYDNDVEFAWGLDLILDGLEQLRHTGATPA